MARKRETETGASGRNEPGRRRMPFNSGCGQAGSEGAEFRPGVFREPAVAPMTARKQEICWNYGIPPREAPYSVGEGITMAFRPGEITLFTGPSGCGKSTLLRSAADHVGDSIWVSRGWPSNEKPVIDSIAHRRPLRDALEILTACGLGEPRLWIRRFSDLSDGERFRASLARAIGDAMACGAPAVIFCDEFAAILHGRLARCLAHNLRKLVTRHRLTLVAATPHERLADFLRPDRLIRLGESGGDLERVPPLKGALFEKAVIERGCVGDYEAFSPMHYRHRDALGFVDRVFVMREKPGGERLGVLVTAHAPLELFLRNRATAGRFIRNPRRLNRELRIVRRLVMHPDVRGCGLGHRFVREALPLMGVRFVECLAAMGEINPIFERAGMTRVGRCPPPRGRLKLLSRMSAMGIDPFSKDFSERVARQPRVRRMVEETVRTWAGAMHGNMRFKVGNRSSQQISQTFMRLVGGTPVYYLWDRAGEFPLPLQVVEKSVGGHQMRGGGSRDVSRDDPDTSRTDSEKGRHRPEE